MRPYSVLAVLLGGIVLAACQSQPPATSPPPSGPTVTPIPPVVTATATEVPYEACGWQWNTEALPDLSSQVAVALRDAGLADVTVRAFAFGENCIGPNGEVARFAAMQTDYDIIVGPAIPENATLIDLVYQIATTLLEEFPAESTPGPNPGRVTLSLSALDITESLIFELRDAQAAYDQGLTGIEFFTALGLESGSQ